MRRGRGSPSRGGGYLSRGSLSRGSLSGGRSLSGVSVQRCLHPDGICPGGLCPRGSLSGWVSVQGSLCLRAFSVQRGLCQEDPQDRDHHPPMDRMIDSSKNINLPQTSFADGKYTKCMQFFLREWTLLLLNSIDQSEMLIVLILDVVTVLLCHCSRMGRKIIETNRH